MCKIIAPALAALSLASIATAVGAETVSVEVEYTDLNLTDPAGLAALDRRIERAINRVCGENRVQSLAMTQAQRRCEAAARASAHEQVARVIRKNTSVALNR